MGNMRHGNVCYQHFDDIFLTSQWHLTPGKSYLQRTSPPSFQQERFATLLCCGLPTVERNCLKKKLEAEGKGF